MNSLALRPYKDNTQLSVNYPIDVRKRLVNVDSRFREEYAITNSSDFVYRLGNVCKNVTSMRLASIEIPNTWYEISAQLKNSFFTVIYLGVSYPIRIADGNYTVTSVMAAVKNALDATFGPLGFAPFLVTLNSPEQARVGISFEVGKTLTFVFDNFWGARNANWGLGYTLGFRKMSYTVSGAGATPALVAEGFADLAGFNYVFLNIDDYRCIEHTTPITGTTANLAKIIVTENKGAILFDNGANLITKEIVFPSPQNIATFRVQIKNGNGDILDLNNMDYSFTLEFTEIANSHLYEEYRKHLVYQPANNN